MEENMNQRTFAQMLTKSVAVAFLALSLNGCTFFQGSEPEGVAMDVPPVSNSLESHKDIVLPTDLEWNSSNSMAITTDSFAGGIYHYSGRLEPSSLVQYIKNAMSNNRWKLAGEAKSKDVMLAFIKPNKTCMIVVSEGVGGVLGKTHVKLYVTTDLAAAKGLNPFGEPVE